jgi:oxygen-independent coproporphyrinogen-3 oxidase
MIISLKKEILIRKRELNDKKIESIYFGGGTPSVLSTIEINSLIQSVYDNYLVDDLCRNYIRS